MQFILTALIGIILGYGGMFSYQKAVEEPTLGATILYPTGGGTGWANIQSGTYLTGNGTGRLATSTCEDITGSADLCDGSDATGSGGAAAVSTSTNETAGRLSYWTSTSGTPATLGEVATGTLSASSPLSVTAGRSVIGGSATLSLDTSGTWTGNAGTATALAANGANCDAGSYARGVDASGAAEDCTADANTTYTAGDALTLTGTDIDFDGGATPNGDLGGTWDAITVDDDSHAHTGATLSGIDISDDTNAAATYPVVLTDDTLSLAFGTTTTNTWVHQIFSSLFATNASSTNATTSSLYVTDYNGLFIDDRADNFHLNINAWDSTNTQDRDLKILVNDGDRFLNLGGDFTITGGSISLTGPASVTLPSSGTLAALGGTNTWTALNTFSTGIIAASSSITNLTAINGTTTNATSTSLNVTGQVDFDGLTSALVLTGATGILAEYAGTSCTNQFVRSLSALGAATCETVANTDLANSSLTVNGQAISLGGSGTITAASSTLLANFNSWTGGNSFGNASTTGTLTIPVGASVITPIAGNIAIDTTSGQLRYADVTGTVRVLSGNTYPAFSYATTTAWTGTTTIPLGPAYVGETWNGVQCFTDTGTLQVSFYDGTNRMNFLNASTTVGTVTLSTNNTFTAAEKRYVDVGTPASSPTKISCTVSKSLTSD